MDEIEQELLRDIKKHMGELAILMKLFSDMRGAYAYKRSEELYEDLAKILAKLDR